MFKLDDTKEYDVMVTNVYQGTYSFNFNETVITGLQKLVQRFVILFLTSLNTKLVTPELGTIFVNSFKGNNVVDKHVINISIMQAAQTLQNDSDGLPLDEQLENLSVDSYIATKDEAQIELIMVNKSGSNTSFVIPIKF